GCDLNDESCAQLPDADAEAALVVCAHQRVDARARYDTKPLVRGIGVLTESDDLPEQRCRAGLAWNLHSVTREGTPLHDPIHRFQALLHKARLTCLNPNPPMGWGWPGAASADLDCRCVGMVQLLVCPAFPNRFVGMG